MKVGDIIQDYQFPTDKGLVLVIDRNEYPVKYFVIAFECAYASWLPEDYMKKCKVINEGADND